MFTPSHTSLRFPCGNFRSSEECVTNRWPAYVVFNAAVKHSFEALWKLKDWWNLFIFYSLSVYFNHFSSFPGHLSTSKWQIWAYLASSIGALCDALICSTVRSSQFSIRVADNVSCVFLGLIPRRYLVAHEWVHLISFPEEKCKFLIV